MLFPGGIIGGIIVLSSGRLYRKASELPGQLWVSGNVNNGSLGSGDRSFPFTEGWPETWAPAPATGCVRLWCPYKEGISVSPVLPVTSCWPHSYKTNESSSYGNELEDSEMQEMQINNPGSESWGYQSSCWPWWDPCLGDSCHGFPRRAAQKPPHGSFCFWGSSDSVLSKRRLSGPSSWITKLEFP